MAKRDFTKELEDIRLGKTREGRRREGLEAIAAGAGPEMMTGEEVREIAGGAKSFIELRNERVRREEAERNVPERVVPGLSLSSFLSKDIVSELDASGWFAPMQQGPAAPKGGKPDTIEEQQFVLDYLSEKGMLPTSLDVNAWRRGQDEKGFTYDPEGVMGGLGFGTVGQYKGTGQESYGPYAGGSVPYGQGIVVTDERGNPIGRYMDANRPEARKAIAAGNFIAPPGSDLTGGWQTEDISQYYNQLTEPTPWERPSMEEVIKGLPPSRVESARYSDYINMLGERDNAIAQSVFSQHEGITQNLREETASINQRLLAGEITPQQAQDTITTMGVEAEKARLELNSQLDSLFTSDKMQSVADIVGDLINKGYAGQDLQTAIGEALQAAGIQNIPDLSGALTFEGGSLTDLYNQAVGDTPITNKFGDITGYEPGMRSRFLQEQQANLPPAWGGYTHPVRPEEVEEVEQQDFLQYVNTLGVASNYKKFLLDRYELYRWEWQQSGDPEFLPWLNNYLAGG